MYSSFEWDEEKNKIDIQKHNINFYEAQEAFLDTKRKGKRIYEQENKIY